MTTTEPARLRSCPATPEKVKFFTVADARRHVQRIRSAQVHDRPMFAYTCPRRNGGCGWVHVTSRPGGGKIRL